MVLSPRLPDSTVRCLIFRKSFSIMDRYKTIKIMFCLSIKDNMMWCTPNHRNVEDVRILCHADELMCMIWCVISQTFEYSRYQQVHCCMRHVLTKIYKKLRGHWFLAVGEILWAYLQLFQCLVCPWRFECRETISIEPLDTQMTCNIKTNSQAKAHAMWANLPQNGCNVRKWKPT